MDDFSAFRSVSPLVFSAPGTEDEVMNDEMGEPLQYDDLSMFSADLLAPSPLSASFNLRVPSPAPPPGAMSSFPPETIMNILELGTEPILSSGRGELFALEGVYRFLLTTSLVNRDWRTQSQMLLFRRIAIKNERRWKLLLENPLLAVYKTRFLRLYNVLWSGDGASPLDRFDGLRQLELHGFQKDEDASKLFGALCSPGLTGLTSLRLAKSTIRQLARSPIPFSLNSLTIEYLKFEPPTLLSSLPTQSLSKLHVSCYASTAPETFAFIFSVAPQLRDFTLFFINGVLEPENIAIFSAFGTLEVLELDVPLAQLVPIITLVPSQLSSLTLWTGRNLPKDAVDAVRGILEVPCLVKLERLSLFSFHRWTLSGLVGGREIINVLEKRGVKLYFKETLGE